MMSRHENAPSNKARTSFIYGPKEAIMTNAEMNFYHRLERIAQDKYYIFPQIHLSALLTNHTKGRYWKAAFQRINRHR